MVGLVGDVVFLVGAGAVASLIGSAGGITSLISYPALLAVGIAPLPAAVVNAVALVASGVGSTLTSRPELRDRRELLVRLSVPALVGGTVGAVLLLTTPPELFAWIVPLLVGSASVLLLLQPRISRRRAQPRHDRRTAALLGVFAASVYGGYFGAGAGVLTLALLLVLVDQDLPRANACKNLVLGIAGVLTAAVFVLVGDVQWTAVIPLAIGALVGGALGPVVVRRAPTRVLRVAAALAGFALAAWLLIDAAGGRAGAARAFRDRVDRRCAVSHRGPAPRT